MQPDYALVLCAGKHGGCHLNAPGQGIGIERGGGNRCLAQRDHGFAQAILEFGLHGGVELADAEFDATARGVLFGDQLRGGLLRIAEPLGIAFGPGFGHGIARLRRIVLDRRGFGLGNDKLAEETAVPCKARRGMSKIRQRNRAHQRDVNVR